MWPHDALRAMRGGGVMIDDDKIAHYDATKHTRFRESYGYNWTCLDCKEIAEAKLRAVMGGDAE